MHALDGEECGQVGGVSRHNDQREKPPRAAHHPARCRPDSTIRQSNLNSRFLVGIITVRGSHDIRIIFSTVAKFFFVSLLPR